MHATPMPAPSALPVPYFRLIFGVPPRHSGHPYRGGPMTPDLVSIPAVITQEQLLKHWQGHRALTRRVIEAFPDDQLFTFSVGGMRPFSALAMEFIGMGVPTLQGIITGEWPSSGAEKPATKADILRL